MLTFIQFYFKSHRKYQKKSLEWQILRSSLDIYMSSSVSHKRIVENQNVTSWIRKFTLQSPFFAGTSHTFYSQRNSNIQIYEIIMNVQCRVETALVSFNSFIILHWSGIFSDMLQINAIWIQHCRILNITIICIICINLRTCMCKNWFSTFNVEMLNNNSSSMK